MKFVMNRNRTIASTCGLSIEFKKGELHLVPPAMYAEVIAAGGVPENELAEDELPPGPATPEALAQREAEMFAAFEKLVLRNNHLEFTAGGVPHSTAMAKELGWPIQAKERDAAWLKFTASKG
jgi:hypothetical protein